MEELIETVTRGNVAEVKAVLASVAAGVAIWQVALMVVGYGKVELRALDPAPATRAHRAIGDALLVVIVTAAVMCVGYFGLEEAFGGGSEGLHALACVIASCLPSSPPTPQPIRIRGCRALAATARWMHSAAIV